MWFSFYKIEVTFMSPHELNILADDPIQKGRCFSNKMNDLIDARCQINAPKLLGIAKRSKTIKSSFHIVSCAMTSSEE